MGETAPIGAALADAQTPETFLAAVDAIQKEHAAGKPEEFDWLNPQKMTVLEQVKADRQKRFQDLDNMTEAAEAIRKYEAAQAELREKAAEILHEGHPLKFLLDAFRLNHQGHEEITRAILYSTVLQSSQTTKGIQVAVVGSKGAGKSSAIKSTVHLMPRSHLVESSFSPKALYYTPPPEKTILFLDDITLSEELLSLVKRAMSNFQCETTHATVIDKKGVLLKIPRRMVFLGSSVWEAGDDQLKDRCLNVGIANDGADDLAYYQFESKRREEGRPELITPEDVLICREILQHIKAKEFVVKMCKIQFAYISDRRLVNQFYDLAEASAILNYLQRNHKTENGVIVVEADERDVVAASDFTMFRILNPASDGRMTRAEVAFDNIFQEQMAKDNKGSVLLSESEIVARMGKSLRTVRATLYGKNGSQTHIDGGLFEKCSWYSFIENDHGRNDIMICKRPGFGLQSSFAGVVKS